MIFLRRLPISLANLSGLFGKRRLQLTLLE